MWSYVRSKAHPRWLWHAIDHHTGTVLAYVFGRRQDTVFLELQALLEPFGITRYFTDGWGAYERHVAAEQHTVGKANTQKIESKHINLRTRIKRLVRRTICFSHIPPDLVVECVTAYRKPPEVRIWRLSSQSRVGTVPPSTSTPHCPACMARR
jgi:insertion element IS1 protein InsB